MTEDSSLGDNFDADLEDGSDTDEVELPAEDEPDSPPTAVLPDGSILSLTGAGAGRQSAATPAALDDTLERLRLRDRDESLDSGAPLVLLHRPQRGAGQTPRLLASVVAATRGRVSVGVVSPLPTLTPTSNQAWLDSCGVASVRIADPLCFKLDPDLAQRAYSTVTVRNWPRLCADPSNVTDVLDAQRAAGANLLLTPGRIMPLGDAQQALDDVCAEADNALAELGRGERLALNLTLQTDWFTNAALRGVLLDQLLDQEQFDTWYVRVLWPNTPTHPQQPTRHELLQGYKRLAQLADDEERKLLLPQTGLTGWLQLAFGAAGFGTSPTGAGQGFRRAQGGGGGFAPVERYFEPALLHVVERPVHDALLRTLGYVRCTCPYCPALHATAVWNHELAGFHHAYWCGRLADPGVRPAGSIRRTVRAAVREAAGLTLTGANEAVHLAAWDRLL